MPNSNRGRFRTLTLIFLVATTLLITGISFSLAASGASGGRPQTWVATFGTSPVAPMPTNTTNPGFNNQTVRMIVHTSGGGRAVRVTLSNVFGTEPLVVGAVHIALHGVGVETVAGTDRALTFSGSGSIAIPPGALVVSDSANLAVPALSDLAVSVYLPGSTGQATWHRDGHSTNYVSATGDFTAQAQMPVDHTVSSWFYLTGVQVLTSAGTRAVVTLGDSITDGTASKDDANHRWPNFLAERFNARHFKLTVVDQGIGGNRILRDGAGPNALARFERDVLAQPGVGYVTVMLGINDIGRASAPPAGQPAQEVTAEELIAGHKQMVARAHQQGLKIFGCTLTPYEGAPYFRPGGEAIREAVNTFIRSGGVYDGVIDFDAALRDPGHPARLQSAYDSGDHLHPNDEGYRAMANAVDLSLFGR